MWFLEFNFSVGGGGDARWGWDWKQAKLTVHVYKTSHFFKAEEANSQRAWCGTLWPRPQTSAPPPQQGELEPIPVDQLSWEWVSADCLRLLMVCCPALPCPAHRLEFILRTDRAPYFKRQYLLLFAFDLKKQGAKLFIKVHQMTLIQLWK